LFVLTIEQANRSVSVLGFDNQAASATCQAAWLRNTSQRAQFRILCADYGWLWGFTYGSPPGPKPPPGLYAQTILGTPVPPVSTYLQTVAIYAITQCINVSVNKLYEMRKNRTLCQRRFASNE